MVTSKFCSAVLNESIYSFTKLTRGEIVDLKGVSKNVRIKEIRIYF
jgi:hypothetical protein